jgi:hypothetical protein
MRFRSIGLRRTSRFHRECGRAGFERPLTAKCVQVIDPFGNRIRFNEDLKTGKK